jgi:hypothetical protein
LTTNDFIISHLHQFTRKILTTWNMKATTCTLAEMVSFLVVGLTLFLLPVRTLAKGETKLMLDDMSQFFEGTDYPSSLYDELSACMRQWGVQRLEEAQDVSWKQFYDAYVRGGPDRYPPDPWGGYKDEFMESKNNRTAIFGTKGRTYEVVEKCNYVSNVALYRAAVRVCKYEKWTIPVEDRIAMMQSFVTSGTASHWFHGSMTNIGAHYDGIMLKQLITNAYRIAIRSTGTNSTILLTVSDYLPLEPISVTASQLAYTPLNIQNIFDWWDYLAAVPIVQSFNILLVALLTIACAAVSPFFICECFVRDIVAPAFITNATEADFFKNKYIPELKILIEDEGFQLYPWEGIPILIKFAGVVSALLWALTFQEVSLPTPCLVGDFFNVTRLGAMKSPFVNVFSYFLHGVENTDRHRLFDDRTSHPYPGSKFCNTNSPHALFHERIADAVFELYVVVDEMEQVFKRRNKRRRLQQVAAEGMQGVVEPEAPLALRGRLRP